jgi:hypothetical protein
MQLPSAQPDAVMQEEPGGHGMVLLHVGGCAWLLTPIVIVSINLLFTHSKLLVVFSIGYCLITQATNEKAQQIKRGYLKNNLHSIFMTGLG